MALHKIPKIIHQIWYQGEDNVPSNYKKYALSWTKKNVDYEYVLWSEKEIKQLITVKFQKYLIFFNSLPTMIQKIDFAKYCIMYEHGGVYADMDSECINGVDSLFQSSKETLYVASLSTDFFENLVHGYHDQLYNNGWFASSKKNVFWKLLMSQIKKEDMQRKWYDTNISYIFRTTGPKIFSHVVNTLRNSIRIKILENGLFEPIKWIDYTCDKDIDYESLKECYCIHHYGSKMINGQSWQSNGEIITGITLHYIKQSWYLFAALGTLIVLDHVV